MDTVAEKSKMPVMADRKPGRGRPPADEPTVSVSGRISPALAKILDQYLKDTKPKTTTSAVIELALERYFAELDLWAPAGEGEE